MIVFSVLTSEVVPEQAFAKVDGHLQRPHKEGATKCGECVAHVSATMLIFTTEWFLMALLFDWSFWEKVDDAMCVLGVDRVVPIVMRVLVWW